MKTAAVVVWLSLISTYHVAAGIRCYECDYSEVGLGSGDYRCREGDLLPDEFASLDTCHRCSKVDGENSDGKYHITRSCPSQSEEWIYPDNCESSGDTSYCICDSSLCNKSHQITSHRLIVWMAITYTILMWH